MHALKAIDRWGVNNQSMNRILASAALALSLTAGGSPAAAQVVEARCGEVVDGAIELCRTTTFAGDASGVASVRLTNPARLLMTWTSDPEGPNEAIRISGAGRYVGLAITHDPRVYDESWGSDHIVAARFGRCGTPGCDPGKDAFGFISPSVPGDGPADHLDLAPGRYRVYLTTDGAPAAVSLTLEGPEGEGLVRPASPASAIVKTPTPRTSIGGPGLPTLHAAGDRFTIPGPGFSLGVMWVTSEESPGVPLGGQFGQCVYGSESMEADDRVLYGPQCGAFSFMPLLYPGTGVAHMSDADRAMIFHGSRDAGYGEVRYGLWYTSPMPLVAAMATIVSVDF